VIVCICHGVSDRAIAEAAAGGCSFDEMQRELRVATACSSCLEYAHAVFKQHVGAKPPADAPDAGGGLAPRAAPGAPSGQPDS
jgi:bacterioferritin-associated ferredoxin